MTDNIVPFPTFAVELARANILFLQAGAVEMVKVVCAEQHIHLPRIVFGEAA